MNEPLSRYFSWTEALHSQTAARLGLDNTPNADTQAAIIATALSMDHVREHLGHPIYVSSWYRSPKVNSAVGSKSTSQHIKGEAVDFVCPGFGTVTEVFDNLRHMAPINYDQIICEFGAWVHISFANDPRDMALIIDRDGVRNI